PPGRSAATILVAEDNPRLAAMIARLLSDEHTVVVALDGLAALELAQRHEPHLLVTDVDMPGMDGIALTRKFRERQGAHLAAAASSSYGRSLSRIWCSAPSRWPSRRSRTSRCGSGAACRRRCAARRR